MQLGFGNGDVGERLGLGMLGLSWGFRASTSFVRSDIQADVHSAFSMKLKVHKSLANVAQILYINKYT